MVSVESLASEYKMKALEHMNRKPQIHFPIKRLIGNGSICKRMTAKLNLQRDRCV